MGSIKSTILSFLVGIAALGAASSPAFAVTLDVRSGLLHGAFNVNVGGSLYDVEFLEGSCVALFSGCDETSDFTFQTEQEARSASQALRDHVLFGVPEGNFVSDPSLIFGTPNGFLSKILTPFAILASLELNSSSLANFVAGSTLPDGIGIERRNDPFDDLGEQSVYAKWTSVSVVPLPAALPLYGAGLAVMGFIGWSRSRKAARV